MANRTAQRQELEAARQDRRDPVCVAYGEELHLQSWGPPRTYSWDGTEFFWDQGDEGACYDFFTCAACNAAVNEVEFVGT